MNEITEITTERLAELLEAEDLLQCLQACGVDNWDGYCDAVEMLEEAL